MIYLKLPTLYLTFFKKKSLDIGYCMSIIRELRKIILKKRTAKHFKNILCWPMKRQEIQQ